MIPTDAKLQLGQKTLFFDWVRQKTWCAERFPTADPLVEAPADAIQYFIIPSYACNIKCEYCFQKASPLKGKTMGVPELQAVFERIDCQNAKASRSKKTCVSLFGGEPLIPANKQFTESFIDEIKKRSFSFKIFTNGVGIGDYLPMLAANKIHLDCIHVTFDGDKKIHDKRRGKGVYGKVIENIALASDEKIPIVARINADEKSACKASGLLEDLSKIPGTKAYFAPVREGLCANAVQPPTGAAKPALLCALEASEKYGAEIKGWPGVEQGKAAAEGRAVPAPKSGFCQPKMLFDPFGYIYPCICTAGYPQFATERIFPKSQKLGNWWAEFNSANKQQCAKCQWFYACGGGCNLEWKIGQVSRCAKEIEQNLALSYEFYSSKRS